jgi:hypothetical protein
MSPFDALSRGAVSTLQSVFGSSTAFLYSRPAGPQFDAIAPFAINGALNAGGEYATPTGPFAASFLVRPSDIPLGPQKGDLITIAAAPARMKSGNYRVQEIFMDAAAGWASLAIRFVQ